MWPVSRDALLGHDEFVTGGPERRRHYFNKLITFRRVEKWNGIPADGHGLGRGGKAGMHMTRSGNSFSGA